MPLEIQKIKAPSPFSHGKPKPNVEMIKSMKEAKKSSQQPFVASCKSEISMRQIKDNRDEKIKQREIEKRREMDPRFAKGVEGDDSVDTRKAFQFVFGLRKQELGRDEAKMSELIKQRAEMQNRNINIEDIEEQIQELGNMIRHNKQLVGQTRARDLELSVKDKIRNAEKDAVLSGKKAYYMKKNDIKETIRAERFNALKKNKGAKIDKMHKERIKDVIKSERLLNDMKRASEKRAIRG